MNQSSSHTFSGYTNVPTASQALKYQLSKDDYKIPSTIDDELVYPEIHELLDEDKNVFIMQQ